MPKQIIQNPTPPPPPKIVLFVGLIALAAIAYLVSVAIKAERELENVEEGLVRGSESI